MLASARAIGRNGHKTVQLDQTNCLRILMADDEDIVLRLYQRILESDDELASDRTSLASFKGMALPVKNSAPLYDVTFCHQGEEAVELIRVSKDENRPFAMAFLDIQMPPGEGGIWAAEKIREIDHNIQIVMVTGHSDIDPTRIAERIPPLNRLLYLKKPCHPCEIRHCVATLAARWHAENKMRHLNLQLEETIKKQTAQLLAATGKSPTPPRGSPPVR
jgi:CheY-like chemotaxis protein